MVRIYQRKTNRGSIEDALMESAADDVANGKSINSASKNHGINRMTLTRYINRARGAAATESTDTTKALHGYKNVADFQRVFCERHENDLADHTKELANQFHGLSSEKLQSLAYEFAIKNDVVIPRSWHSHCAAGKLYSSSD